MEPYPTWAVLLANIGVGFISWSIANLLYKLCVLVGRVVIHSLVAVGFTVVRGFQLLRRLCHEIRDSLDFDAGALAPLLRSARVPVRDTIAYNRAISEAIPLLPQPAPVIDLSTSVVQYDALLGPHARITVNGIETVVRLNPLNHAVSLSPPIETGGKEAVLLSSVTPQPAQPPSSQVSITLGGKHHGWAVRIDSKTLLTTKHQLDQVLTYAGTVCMERGGKQIPLDRSKLHPVGRFPSSSDQAAFSLEPGTFSAIGVTVAKRAAPISGQFQLFTHNDMAQSVLCVGTMQRSEGSNLIFVHNGWSKPGTSGAPIWQGDRVVAIHTGSNAQATENYATSMTYVDQYLNPLADVKESFYADGNHSRDLASEKLVERLLKEEFSHRNARNMELATVLDDLSSEIQERRYNGSLYARDQVEDLLQRSKLDDLTQDEIKTYLYGQSGTRGMSKKNLKKFGVLESDIKGDSRLSSAATSSSKAATPTPKDSKPLVEPAPSEPVPERPRAPSLTVSDIKKLITEAIQESLAKPSPTPPPTETLMQSSAPSSSSTGGLHRPEIAASMVSEKASKKRFHGTPRR